MQNAGDTTDKKEKIDNWKFREGSGSLSLENESILIQQRVQKHEYTSGSNHINWMQ